MNDGHDPFSKAAAEALENYRKKAAGQPRSNQYEPLLTQEQLAGGLPIAATPGGFVETDKHGIPLTPCPDRHAFDMSSPAAVFPTMTAASEWKHTSAAGHTIEIRSGTAPATPLATQVGGAHYKDMKVQPVEYIHANGIGYFEGNVIKYVSRWREKGGVADLEKAKHYIDLLIELERRPEAGNKI